LIRELRDESAAWPTLDVDDNVKRIADVRLDCLGAIYRTHWTNLFAFYGLHLSDFERDQAMFAPPKTQTCAGFAGSGRNDHRSRAIPRSVATGPDKSFLKAGGYLGRGSGPIDSANGFAKRTYGFVGMSDNRMSPLIRPGSIVQIDQNQRKILNVKWENEYDRPIYFLELRGAYLCSWCEIGGGYLSAIPHPIPNAKYAASRIPGRRISSGAWFA